MWGNKLGWGISGAMFIVMLGLVLLIETSNRVSPPTAFGRKAENLAKIELPVNPRGVVTTVMTAGCDAGEHYRKAIDSYIQNPGPYERFAKTRRLNSPEAQQMPAIDLILQGASCGQMKLFSNRLEEVINYQNNKKSLDAIHHLGETTLHLGLLHKAAGNLPLAKKHCEAAFALGTHLYEERVVYMEMLHGLGLLGQSATVLASIADAEKDAAKAQALRDFDAQRTSYFQERIVPMYRVVSSIDSKVVRRHSGDLFHFAGNAQEPMWRIESVLAIGRMKYYVGQGGRAGDQRGALRYVRELAGNPGADPAVRIAAQAAADLTIEQYRMLR